MGNDRELWAPEPGDPDYKEPDESRWIICPTCEGDGTTVNPNIDANGISMDAMREDPDFYDAYMGGTYDVPCGACGGSGKMRESRINELREAAADRRLAAMEDGDYEGYSMAHDWRYGA